jgi:hypothetical protein
MSAEDLIPMNQRSLDEAKELGRQGGIASGKARREKKVIRELYFEALSRKYKVLKPDGSTEEIAGTEKFIRVWEKLMDIGNSSSVSLMREMRESIDGTDLNVNGQFAMTPEQEEEFKAILERHGIKPE